MNKDHKLPKFDIFLEHKKGKNTKGLLREKIVEGGKILGGNELFDIAVEVYDKIPLPTKYSPKEFTKLITDKKSIKKALKGLKYDDSSTMVDKIQAIIAKDVE